MKYHGGMNTVRLHIDDADRAVRVRSAGLEDMAQLHRIHSELFGRSNEADLAVALLRAGKAVVSLGAVLDDLLIGHVLFSPVTVSSRDVKLDALGLAPVAVLPSYHGIGIGSRLVREGLDACRSAGYDAVVVLGDPKYYSRFGFVKASSFGLSNEYGVDDEFMLLALKLGVADRCHGIVRYAAEFAETGC